MAKIRYGGLVSDVRGSVGGVTFRGGSGGGIISSKAGAKNTRTERQERQQTLIAEARRAWQAMSSGSRSAFTFVYTQKQSFRPVVGQRWATAIGAYTAWYVGLRLCGVTPGEPTTPLMAWAYYGAGSTGLYGTGFSLEEGFYASATDATASPMAIWAVNPNDDGMPPARAVWTEIYCGLTDVAAELVTVPGYGTAWNFTPFLQARGMGRFLGSNVIFRVYRAVGDIGIIYNDHVQVVTV